MQKKIKTIIFDLEGTLLNDEGKISIKNQQAIFAAQNHGINFILASGLNCQVMKSYAYKINVKYFVCNNGMSIYSLKDNKVLNLFELIKRKDSKKVTTIFSKFFHKIISEAKVKHWQNNLDKISKLWGIMALSLAFDFKASSVMVFGDSINDLEMIKWAKYSCVMANAVDEVKKVANKVIGSNNSNTIATQIQQLVY